MPAPRRLGEAIGGSLQRIGGQVPGFLQMYLNEQERKKRGEQWGQTFGLQQRGRALDEREFDREGQGELTDYLLGVQSREDRLEKEKADRALKEKQFQLKRFRELSPPPNDGSLTDDEYNQFVQMWYAGQIE